jgi:hypothetical protein
MQQSLACPFHLVQLLKQPAMDVSVTNNIQMNSDAETIGICQQDFLHRC